MFLKEMEGSKFLTFTEKISKLKNFVGRIEPWAQSYQHQIPQKISVFSADFQISKNLSDIRN
jgi:hypothetical protein